ncbi:TonB-dependent receptor [Neiella marina]|uniref:TonB-dependent receptor n=1 Tax=Neiella holothuriorum TaxID=2870530 RepID=A0ABS7EER7_9GAMM|nr:TonB-dependent receptor [Neiella holothuriorum]MBW8190730.1 TonB-dependent receptor [Neiella holothuriorum]
MQFRLSKIAVAVLSASTLSLVSAAYAAEEESQLPADDVEVIQVSGIAGSMAESARQKRFSNQIVDAIVAEDIGKLPDNNIAEALQRITGISISSDFGVGESVTIRGISENRVELNGRSTSGTGRGGISLDDFPSSFLKTVSVIKSPTADMIEGALGGTVNMETVRPLELQEPLVAMTLDGEYADKTENFAPKLTFAAGRNWDLGNNGTFGANFVFSYLDREIRQDEFQTKVNSTESIDGFEEEALGPNGTFQYRSENTVRLKTEDRERTAYAASFQWAPSSNEGNIYLDLSYSELSGGQAGYDFLDVGGTVTANENTSQTSNGYLTDYDLVGAFVIPKTESDFAENDSYSHALGGEWQLSDRLKVSSEFAMTGAEENGVNSQLNLRPVDLDTYYEALESDPTASPGDYMNKVTATVSHESDKVSSVVYDDPDLLTSGDTMVVREFFYDEYKTETDEKAFRFDAEYAEPMDLDWISSVQVGIRLTDSSYEYNQATLYMDPDEETKFGDAYKKAMQVDDNGNETDYHAAQTSTDSFSGIIEVNHDNLFDQAGFAGENMLAGTVNAYDAELLRDDPNGTFEKFQALWVGTTYETTGSLQDNLVEDVGEWKKIEEETRAVYMQFNLDFDELTAVVGARYIETDLDSTIIEDTGYSTGSNDYSDFLPSLNVSYSISDDTIARFAAAKVMRRAAFTELSPAYSISGTSYLTGTQGSYELDPYRVTQFDMSLEHYFGDGGLVSGAVFYKDVESFTVESTYCYADSRTVNNQQTDEQWSTVCLLENAGESTSDINTASGMGLSDSEGMAYVEGMKDAGLTGVIVSRDVNGGSGEVVGFELAYQQTFNFLPGPWAGLGMSTNYTYAHSEQPNGLPLENISDHSYNLQLYWEWEGFQTRLAYNWRDEFLDDEDYGKRLWGAGSVGLGYDSERVDVTSGNSYRKSRGQLDYSASYDYNENLTFVGNVVNLTSEPLVYKTARGDDWRITEADRRITVGLRAKF